MRFFTAILLVGFFTSTYSQESSQKNDSTKFRLLNIYIDCNFCDHRYLRQNLLNVNFVRDRKVADVHLLFTRQRTGAGGWSERIEFIGIGKYRQFSDTLGYMIDATMSSDEQRKMQLKYIEFGLLRMWLHQGLGENLTIESTAKHIIPGDEEDDPWKGWIFGVNAGTWFNGQETSNTFNIDGSLSARRITERNKFQINAGANQKINHFYYEDNTTSARQQNSWLNVTEIVGFTDHFSWGVFGYMGNSIFRNYKLYGELATGVEYDVFKYSESFDKQLIAAYEIGVRYNDYYDTTVFDKSEETVGFHRFTLGGMTKQAWGNFSSTMIYYNYLHDFALNEIRISMNLNVRVFKGFNFRINGGFGIQHNQINIAKGTVSTAELLLQQQQLKSGFNYWGNTGFNYSFGSIYNTAVNPRFDF